MTRLEPRTLHQSGKLKNSLRTRAVVPDLSIFAKGKVSLFCPVFLRDCSASTTRCYTFSAVPPAIAIAGRVFQCQALFLHSAHGRHVVEKARDDFATAWPPQRPTKRFCALIAQLASRVI